MTSDGRKIDTKTVEKYIAALLESFVLYRAGGYDVYVGKVNDLEIDFVVSNERGRVYFQVAATVRSEEVLRRELASLQQIPDHYPKYILTLDNDPEADYEGIRRMNALEWLVGEND